MAVLTAIAVIVAALVFAETVLVYVALGLAGVSVLLLLGALLQGRSGGGGGPDRTDGLGKASVPVMAATAASAVPIAHVESENPGRVPAPASEPVREPHVPERPAWPSPAAEDAGHGEPEYDVPRWQTPTAHDWPEPDTAAHDAAPSAPHAGPSPSWASPEEEQPLRAPVSWESGADTADTAARAEWDEPSGTTAAEDGPGTGDGTGERTAAAFTYDIPGRTPPADDGPSAEDRPPFGEDAVEEDIDDAPFADGPDEHGDGDGERERGGSVFASEKPFVYSIPRPAQAVEESFPESGDDDSVSGARDGAPSAQDVSENGGQDGDGDGGQATGAGDRASFAYDIPGRSATEGTVEEDAFVEDDDGDRPDEEESGAFAYDVPGVSSAEDAPSPGDGSRAARDAAERDAEEDIDDAPFADVPEKRDAGEPGEDTAAAGTDGVPEPDEASVPAADHEDARGAAERLEEPDEDSEPADDRQDAPEAHVTEQAPSGPGTDGDGPETAVLPAVSADSGPEEEHAPDDAGTDEATGETADSTGNGARTDDEADERAADADRIEDEDSGDGRGASSGAFSYHIPRGGDGEEDGARAGDVPAAAESDREDTGEDDSAARAERPADGAEDGPDEDGARDTADRASDDASDTKR
ncbi:AAA family ATPase [Nocardiopsis dassonvillei]|uniref:AAA family ATPase n=1 Tax=Nocardiopsis dassonvillei TaxID=2014 RepID=UPI00363C2C54